jgi:hypothetical protein
MSSIRRCRRLAAGLIAAGAALGGAASPASALILPPVLATPGYRFVTVDPPGSSGQDYLTSVLADGTAVGSYTDSAGAAHGFIRQPLGGLPYYDVPGAAATFLTGIDAQGVMSGTFADATGAQHGFVRDASGVLRQIDIPGAVATTGAMSEFGTGLGTAVATTSADGTVVGDWGDGAGASHGFLLGREGQRTDLDAPGASTAFDPLVKLEGGTIAIRMNSSGTVVGSYAPGPRASLAPVDLRACMETGGAWTTLLPAGATTSQAFAITDAGQAGGVAFNALGLIGYGWVWKSGRFTRIDPQPLALYSTVDDIAPNGVITGEYETIDLYLHGYIGFPT